MQKQYKKLLFFARRTTKALAEGRSSWQQLEVSLRSKLYLLVYLKTYSEDVEKSQKDSKVVKNVTKSYHK